jgi:hypothetical protein
MSPLKPSAVECKDGFRFAVERQALRLVVTTPVGDHALEDSGIAAFADRHQRTRGVLRHTGVPLDALRHFIRLHGGYAGAGPLALAVLQRYGQAPAPEPASAPAEVQVVEEAAPAPEHPGPPLDELTSAVIAARKALAKLDAEPPLTAPNTKQVFGRIGASAVAASLLEPAFTPRYAKHPLVAEAIGLYARLEKIKEAACKKVCATSHSTDRARA